MDMEEVNGYIVLWAKYVLLLLFFCGVGWWFIYTLWRALDTLFFTPRRVRQVFESQGIPCLPSPHLLYGNLPEITALRNEARQRPMPTITNTFAPRILPHYYLWSKTYGALFVYWNGPPARVILPNPEHAKEVLSTQFAGFRKSRRRPDISDLIGDGLLGLEGATWSKHRDIMNPAFFHEKLKAMLPTMGACMTSMMEKWAEPIRRGHHIEVYKEFKNLTGDIIAHTAFGSSYAEGKRVFELQQELQVIVDQLLVTVYIPGSRFLPTKLNRRRWRINNDIKKIFMNMVKGRLDSAAAMKMGDDDLYGSDLLGLMMAANQGKLKETSKKNLSMDIPEIIGECKTFFFAGHETTSTLLTWASLLLSVNPEWQDRVREEVFEVCGRTEMPTAGSIPRLKIMAMVLNESLRLYPPVVALLRRTVKDIRLGGESGAGILIPEGTEVVLPLLTWHHDPKYWGHDADKFRPERFGEGGARRPGSGAFIPFSMGPRACIGRAFSMLEAKLVMAMLVQRFSFSVSPSYRHAPTAALSLQPEYGMPLILCPLS